MVTGLVYTVGALCIKRATTHGIGPWRTTFFSNLILFLVSAPLWFFGPPIESWRMLAMPLLVGTFFFIGQLLTCLAIHKGDVSLVTPLLGMKTLWVAFILWLGLGEKLPAEVWLAACLSTAAVFLMRGKSEAERRRVFLSVVFGLGCSLSYAFADAAMQAYGSELGFAKLTAGSFTVVMLYSFLLVPRFGGSMAEVSPQTRRWLLAGAVFLALQAVMMAFALSTYGRATVVNVIYSSRGIWSVILVWVVGHWFSNAEQALGGSVLLRRLLGSLLLVAAIVAAMQGS